MSWNITRAVLVKEVVDGTRDRRALLSALIFPLSSPIMIAVMMNFLADPTDLTGKIDIPVIGAEHAPMIVATLEDNGMNIVEAPENPKEAVRLGEEEVVISIPENFNERFEQSKPVYIEVILDESRVVSQKRVARIQSQIQRLSMEIGMKRLMARGVDPSVAHPVIVSPVNMATPRTKGANLLEMVGMFSVMAAFLCNMYVAIDATAGERERGSLEPLLLNPASRWGLVSGKWLATIAFGITGEILMLSCTAVAMQQIPFEGLGMRLEFGAMEAVQIFLYMVPLIVMAGAGQLLLAAYAKSFKEAQSYLSTALFLPTLPGLILMINPMQPELWMATVPALSHQLLCSRILRGDEISLEFASISVLSTLCFAVLFLYITKCLFDSESFFFRN